MKRFSKLQLFIFISLIFLLPFNVKAESKLTIYTLNTHLQFKGGPNRDHLENCKDGYRSPSRPITINISRTDGVQIPHVDKNEILSYSIYDEEETCLATFTNEADFVDFVFSTTGEVEIRIELADYYLCGWLQL